MNFFICAMLILIGAQGHAQIDYEDFKTRSEDHPSEKKVWLNGLCGKIHPDSQVEILEVTLYEAIALCPVVDDYGPIKDAYDELAEELVQKAEQEKVAREKALASRQRLRRQTSPILLLDQVIEKLKHKNFLQDRPLRGGLKPQLDYLLTQSNIPEDIKELALSQTGFLPQLHALADAVLEME